MKHLLNFTFLILCCFLSGAAAAQPQENIEYKAPTYQVTNINDDINRNAASSINNNVFVNSMAKIDNSMVTKNGASSFFAKEKESPPLIIENNNIEKNT